MIERLNNRILEIFCQTRLTKFMLNSKSLKKIQSNILLEILSDSYEYNDIQTLDDFKKKIPIIKYPDISDQIDISVACNKSITKSKVKYFQPTSGSTSKEKWIPYTDRFLNELNFASLAWIADIYKNYPKVKHGRQYWSLSWLPEEIRHKRKNDDLEVLGFLERILLKNIMALPWDVSQFPSAYTSMLGTSVGLINSRDLSLISIWSPTYLLSILNFIKDNKDLIIKLCENRRWDSESKLSKFKFPKVSKQNLAFLKEWSGENISELSVLWPKLALISCWDSSTSKKWADELKAIFPNVPLQGKGLWATEGVISIPITSRYPLSYMSHFYEFLNVETNEIKFSWELQKNEVVKPILTTGSGIYRYILEDRILVKDFLNSIPCFEFLGRACEVDMVGEKISYEVSQEIIKDVENKFNVDAYFFIADSKSNKPIYKLITKRTDINIGLKPYIESRFQENFHYKVARQMGQLDHAEVEMTDDPLTYYNELKKGMGILDGNMKFEPLIEI